MVKDGTLEGFRTPGGRLRIGLDSVDTMRNHRHALAGLVREASPVLQNRRERLEGCRRGRPKAILIPFTSQRSMLSARTSP
jgi:hypothetical protein